jgi:hypothetical protein
MIIVARGKLEEFDSAEVKDLAKAMALTPRRSRDPLLVEALVSQAMSMVALTRRVSL